MEVISPIIAGKLILLPLKCQAPSGDAACDPTGDHRKVRFIRMLPAVHRFMPQDHIHQVSLPTRHGETTNRSTVGQYLKFHAPCATQDPGLDLSPIRQTSIAPTRQPRRLLTFCHPIAPHQSAILAEIPGIVFSLSDQ